MDSLSVVEVMPIAYNRGRKVIHTYSKVKVKELTAERIRSLYINLGFKTAPTVSPLLDFYMITFYPKPPILISKKDGRLYSFLGKWDRKEVQHQASLVMRVLTEFNFVDRHKTKCLRRKIK